MTAVLQALRARIAADHRLSEAEAISRLRLRQPDAPASDRIAASALELAARVRAARREAWSAEEFLRHHGLSTAEGVALMCLAEALLRIPDPETADALLRERLGGGNWVQGQNESLLSNAADWALLLTGTLARWSEEEDSNLAGRIRRVVARLGEPVVRGAVRQAMRLLAEQFVLAETIEQAVERTAHRRPACFSFDMLGEAARTAEDASRYLELYSRAIKTASAPDGVSVKLSALHPRYEEAQRARVFSELLTRLRLLAALARDRGIGLTIDAEESERLELTLDLFETLLPDSAGTGLAVQAYQKRAPAVCDWLVQLAR